MSEPTAPDPFDLEAAREIGTTTYDIDVVMTTVPVRKPARNEFIRVHPGRDMVLDTRLLEVKREGNSDTERYWIAPHFIPLMGELADEAKPVRLHLAITKFGTPFLWPCRLPQPDNKFGQTWYTSALRAAEEAKNLWVKLISNKYVGAYEYAKAQGDLGEPVWPDKTFKELLKIAFNDRVIDSHDHPVIREINGEM